MRLKRRIPEVLIIINYVSRQASMRRQGWLCRHFGRCGSRNNSFRNPRYDCWQAPYSVDTFFFIGATLVSYLLLKVLMKIYIKNIKLTFHRTLTRPTGGSTRRVLSTWCSSIWTGLTPKFTWSFLHISKKTSQAFSSTDCFASASLMASSFSSWSGWRTVARILSEGKK